MTIESITKFRTDDGQEFYSEADAIAHEKKADLRQLIIDDGDKPMQPFPDNYIDVIDTHRDAILEYLTGEDLPQPHPAPTFGYRDGDSIEPVHPILFRGEVIRQPEDAWNACRLYALEILNNWVDTTAPGTTGSKRRTYKDVLIKLNELLVVGVDNDE